MFDTIAMGTAIDKISQPFDISYVEIKMVIILSWEWTLPIAFT